MLAETNGGYDEGYRAVTGFWGIMPGSLVSAFLQRHQARGLRVLDVGAGEGKNAAAFARAGAKVQAIECSNIAIGNGRRLFPDADIEWIQSDALTMRYDRNVYDVVISYGLTHCLPTEDDARSLLKKLQTSLKAGGTFLLVSFNSGSHDLTAHPGFSPLLLDHSWFLDMFDGWDIEFSANSILHETHPHNNIPHHHSLTRLTAVKK